jgi:hypothetical protein
VLHGLLQSCIESKESKGAFTPSLPQAYFGEEVADLKIPGFTASVTASSNPNRCPVSNDNAYGVTPAKAIRVGLDESTGPARESQYLNALRGPAGQPLRSSRIGSVLSAGTVLHIFELSYEGLDKPVPVFLDVYHFESPKAPAGFVCGADFGF